MPIPSWVLICYEIWVQHQDQSSKLPNCFRFPSTQTAAKENVFYMYRVGQKPGLYI